MLKKSDNRIKFFGVFFVSNQNALFGAHLPVLLQVADLLPQLLQAGQSLRLSQLHPNQLLLKTSHVGVIW